MSLESGFERGELLLGFDIETDARAAAGDRRHESIDNGIETLDKGLVSMPV